MKIATNIVRALAARQGLSLSALLSRAGVSRTAYYSLARRSSVLPKTVHALARAAGVPVNEILEDREPEVSAEIQERIRTAKGIADSEPETSFENVWHTLCLLEMSPLERLNRSLIRGRPTAIHR